MKTFYTISFLLLIVVAQAQQDIFSENKRGAIAMGSGLSFYSIKDQNVSKEKYMGILTPINLSWTSLITDRQCRNFYFNLNTGKIKNNKVKADVNELTLGWDYCFNLTPQKRHTIFLGPAPFLFLHSRMQAISSYYHINSNFGVISLASIYGIKSNNKTGFNYKITGRLGLLSAAVNTGNDQITKILTPFNGLQFYFSAQSSYTLNKWAVINFKYSFQTYYITAWNKFYSLTDQLTLNLLISF